VISSKISLVIFTVLFTVIVSSMTAFLGIGGITCTDPSEIIEEPPENASTFETAIDSGNKVIDVFFGCNSENPVINGLFLSLQAGIIIVLLFILKDVIPFT